MTTAIATTKMIAATGDVTVTTKMIAATGDVTVTTKMIAVTGGVTATRNAAGGDVSVKKKL